MNEKPRRHKPDRENNELNNANNQPDGRPGCPAPGTPLDHGEALRWSIWRILVQNTTRHGAKVTEVLDAAETHGIDRFRACETLMFWLDRGDIRKSWADNRVVPQRERWKP